MWGWGRGHTGVVGQRSLPPALVALLEKASITLGSFGSNQNRS